MAVSVTNNYNSSVDDTFAAYISEDYAKAKYDSIGSRNFQLLDTSTSGNTTTLKQKREVRANVPGFAKKVLAEWNTIDESYAWTDNGSDKTCVFSAKVAGAPISIEGNTRLTDNGGGTKEEITLNVNVKVPLIGKKLQAQIEQDTKADLATEAAFNKTYLES